MNIINVDLLQADPQYDFIKILSSDQNEEDFSPYTDIDLDCKYYSPHSFLDNFNSSIKGSVLNLNINSLSAHFSDLLDFITFLSDSNFKFSVICLQEIGNIPDNALFNMPGYHPLIFKQREHFLRGGVGIYVSSDMRYSLLPQISVFHEKILESISIEVELSSQQKINVSNIYRPPGQQNDLFLDVFLGMLDTINNLNKKSFLVGDFNLDLLKYQQNNQISTFVDNMFASGFLEIISHPTRVAHNINNSTSSLIDHIWTNDIKESYSGGIITTYISDHFSTFYFFGDTKPRQIPKFITIRKYSEDNINSFKTDLESANFEAVYDSQSAQDSYDLFSSIFYRLYNSHFIEHRVKFNKNIHNLQKWMTPELLEARNQKMKFYKILAKNPTAYNRQVFKEFKNSYNRKIRARKKEYYSELLNIHQGDTKKCWEVTKEAAGLSSKTNKAFTDKIVLDNNIVTGENNIANIFNNHFTTIANSISERIQPSDTSPDSFPEETEHRFSMQNITPAQIIEVVKNMQNKKSSDFTGLSPFLLKKIIHSIKYPLCHIFNLSLQSGVVPSQFKIAKVTPVFKKGGNEENVNDYRPISLLCTFSKILEKLVANALSIYLASNNLIDDFQFGFQNENSTYHPMLHLLNFVSKAINKNEYTIGIFLDITKAFDCVPKRTLLMKLSKMGIQGSALKWFESYLSDRNQFVKIGDSKSEYKHLSCGVPQGSILGPILFLIFFNDLPKSTLLKCLLFCDDTTLLASGSNLEELIVFVNSELKKLSTWFRSNQMSLHPDKTKFTIFHTNPSGIEWDNINLTIDENNVSSNAPNPDLIKPIAYINHESDIPAIKFLGVFFDPSLTFRYHIRKLNEKISRALYILRQCKKILTEKALKTLYYSIFHCHLIYAILIYTSAHTSYLKPIIIKQKMAIRAITNSRYNAHTGPIFKRLNILPFQLLAQYFQLKFMFEFKNNLSPRSFANIWKTRGQLNNGNIFLRNNQVFHVPLARLCLLKRLPYCSLPDAWNKFTGNEQEVVKQATSRQQFSKRLKKHLICTVSVTCNRLLCPSCDLRL
jgi:hypothetical protein